MTHSSLLPSLIVLLPLIVLLGERLDEALDAETADGILYWLLVATIRNRYSGATDTTLGQDIPAARSPDPVRALLTNLGIVGTRVEVTSRDLAGRSVNSPYFLFSFLVTQEAGGHDWWFGTAVAIGGEGGQKLEYHHIHPQATLASHGNEYAKAEINDLANLAFISGKANQKISDRSPAVYFPSLGDDELTAHFVPLDHELRDASAYRGFLTERRRLLAGAMTALLDKYRPSWLDMAATAEPDPLAGSELILTLYESDWDKGRFVAAARRDGVQWSATVVVSNLTSALDAAGEGLDSDVDVGGESVPVHLNSDEVQIPFGPFLVTGTVEEWWNALVRERAEAQPLSQCPNVAAQVWEGERITFPVTSVD